MMIRLFCMECRRAFGSKLFAAAVFLMVLAEMLSSSWEITDMSAGVDVMLDMLFSGTGSDVVLLMMFPLLPYAISYARDMEEHALEFYMVRMNTVPFMTVRFITAIFSAFACVVVSFIVFSVILLCMGHPLSQNTASGAEGYMEFMGSNTTLYLLCYTADRGLSAAMMAACAMFMSVLYPHSFFAFTSPVCIYLLALRLVFPHEVVRTWLIPSSWVDGVYSSPSGGFATLLCKVGVAALVCLVYGGLSVLLAKRRWHYV